MRQQFNTNNLSFLNFLFLVNVNSNLAKFNIFLIILISFIHFAYFTKEQINVIEVIEIKKLIQKKLCNIGDDCNANCNLIQVGDFCKNNSNMLEFLFCDKLTK